MGCNIYLWCFIVLVIILLLSTVPSSQIGGLIVCLHFKGSVWPFAPRIFYGNDFGAILEFSFEGIITSSFSHGNRTSSVTFTSNAIQVPLEERL